MHLTPWHVVGLLATIALIIGVGIYSGRKVRSAADFASGGGKAGAWIVCGAIMGTLVSGQATIGTAQLAFNYGMSAWWFTLGSGIGCLTFGVGLRCAPAAQRMLHLAADRLPGVRPPGGDLGERAQLHRHLHQRGGPDPLCHGAAHHHFPRQPFGGGLDLHPPHGGVRHVRRGVGRRHGRRGETHFALCLRHCRRGAGLRPGQRLRGGCWRRWSTCW